MDQTDGWRGTAIEALHNMVRLKMGCKGVVPVKEAPAVYGS
jgi:hypothetical protein